MSAAQQHADVASCSVFRFQRHRARSSFARPSDTGRSQLLLQTLTRPVWHTSDLLHTAPEMGRTTPRQCTPVSHQHQTLQMSTRCATTVQEPTQLVARFRSWSKGVVLIAQTLSVLPAWCNSSVHWRTLPDSDHSVADGRLWHGGRRRSVIRMSVQRSTRGKNIGGDTFVVSQSVQLVDRNTLPLRLGTCQVGFFLKSTSNEMPFQPSSKMPRTRAFSPEQLHRPTQPTPEKRAENLPHRCL